MSSGGCSTNPSSSTYTYGVGATITAVPTRPGLYTYQWCPNSSLTNCSVKPTISTTETGNKTYYAKWAACTPCSTTYAHTVNCSISVSNNTCVYTTSCKPNYTSIANNGKYNAYCRPKIYTITLNKNGGTGGTGTIYEEYGLGFNNADDETISSISIPTLTGYTFNGYYTSKSGGTQIIDSDGEITGSNTHFTANATIYAQ